MKKTFIIILFIASIQNSKSQNNNSDHQLLKELSENGCKCIDTIVTANKTQKELAIEANKCIGQQAGAYQMGCKLMGIDLSNDKKNKKKKIDLVINTNVNSDEYKKYFNKIERYMLDSCKSMRRIMSASDFVREKSASSNLTALQYYNLGLDELQKNKYSNARTYFEMSLRIDSVFAFAWDNLGISCRKLNDYDGAIYAYKRSLELDPLGIMPLQNIAVAYSFKKEYDNAINAYQKLAELDKNNPEVFYGMGENYVYKDDLEKGLDNMCKAYNLYIENKSPYRSDAEKIISNIYAKMKEQGKEQRFIEILKENNISMK
ncbi:MAG: tetratricopeptide repeat protein [Bacteroidales bacterium]|nr:tetratricopeptide repeat protein [Bacteroidales bacterium]